MPRLKPLASFVCLIALLAFLIAAIPHGPQQANAEPTLRTPRLSDQFVVMHDDDEEEDEEYDDEDYEDDEEEDWDEEDMEEEREELEQELAYMELREAELRLAFGELETLQEMRQILNDADATATLALVAVLEEMDHEEQIEFLQTMRPRTKSAPILRLIRLQLAEAYHHTDQPEQALSEIAALVEGRL